MYGGSRRFAILLSVLSIVLTGLASGARAQNGDGLSAWDRQTRQMEAYALANQVGMLQYCARLDFASQVDVKNARKAFAPRRTFITEEQRAAEETLGAAGSIINVKGTGKGKFPSLATIISPEIEHLPIATVAAFQNQSVQQFCDTAALLSTLNAGLADLDKATDAGDTARQSIQDDADKAYAAGDYARALSLNVKACDAGETEACLHAGMMVANGEGGPRDNARAVALFSRACDAEDSDGDGCNELGKMAYNGTGSTADPAARAAPFFRRACDDGNPDGCDNLGRLYYNGEGFATDMARAMLFFTRACDRHSADGCVDLGRMVANGENIAKNKNSAAAYCRQALALDPDNADAKKELTALGLPSKP